MVEESMSPVPYEFGDHCIFYAVQEASMFFHGKPLTYQERDQYAHERERRMEIKDALKIKARDLDTGIQLLLSKLKENEIVPTMFVCSGKTKKRFLKWKYVERTGAEFKISKGNEAVRVPFPAMICVARGTDNHIWFCPDSDTFDKNFNSQVTSSGRIYLMIAVDRLSHKVA